MLVQHFRVVKIRFHLRKEFKIKIQQQMRRL